MRVSGHSDEDSVWRTLGVTDVTRVLEDVKGKRPIPLEVLEKVASGFRVRRDRPVHFGVQRRQLASIGVVVFTLSAMRVAGAVMRRSGTVHIGFVIEGSAALTPLGGEPVVLLPGDACVVTDWSALDVSCEDGTRGLHVLIPESKLRERGVRVRTTRYRLEGPRTLANPLLALAMSITESEWQPTPTAARIAERALEDLAVGLLVESEDNEVDLDDLRAQFRRRSIEEIVARHRDPDLNPGTLAKQLGVSLRHLQRAFEHSGTTVSEQILRQRVESAATLLTAPGGSALTVAEVARAAGFSSPYELRSALKSRFGALPTQMRGKNAPEGVEFRADEGARHGESVIVS